MWHFGWDSLPQSHWGLFMVNAWKTSWMVTFCWEILYLTSGYSTWDQLETFEWWSSYQSPLVPSIRHLLFVWSWLELQSTAKLVFLSAYSLASFQIPVDVFIDRQSNSESRLVSILFMWLFNPFLVVLSFVYLRGSRGLAHWEHQKVKYQLSTFRNHGCSLSIRCSYYSF